MSHAPAPQGETKAQRFDRLADSRVDKLVTAIRTLGNLGGDSYEFTSDTKERIINRILDELIGVEKKMNKNLQKRGHPAREQVRR